MDIDLCHFFSVSFLCLDWPHLQYMQVTLNNPMFTLTSVKTTVDHSSSMHVLGTWLQFQQQWQFEKKQQCNNSGMTQ